MLADEVGQEGSVLGFPITEVGPMSSNQICTLCPSSCSCCPIWIWLEGEGPAEKGQLAAIVPTLRKDVQQKSDALQLQLSIPVCLGPSAILCSHDTSATSWNVLTMSDIAVDNLSISFRSTFIFMGVFKVLIEKYLHLKSALPCSIVFHWPTRAIFL